MPSPSSEDNALFDSKGEGFIELALVLILVAIVLIVILLLLGPNIREFFNSFALIQNSLTLL